MLLSPSIISPQASFSSFLLIFSTSAATPRHIVPPSIVSSPPVHQQAPGKQPLSLLVSFQSRFSDSTTVSWYKDSAALPGDILQTSFLAEPSAETRLKYPSSRREHGGRYLVAVENNHPEIPENLRRVEVTFNVTVVGGCTLVVILVY